MHFTLFFWERITRFFAGTRLLALVLALLLVCGLRLPAQGQALPTFTYAGVCGEGTVGFGSGLRIAQTVQDTAGNSYVTGYFYDRATFGTFVLQNPGYSMFVAKLDPAGAVVWAVRAVGGAEGRGIAVDAGGNVLVTGTFVGTAVFGSSGLTSRSTISGPSYNIFVAKLSPAGIFSWAVRAGGNEVSGASGIVVDGAGNSYVCGNYSASFSTSDFGPFNLTNNNNSADVFVAKLDPAGTFLWAARGGGSQSDDASGIALDAAGSVYITGYFVADPGVPAWFGLSALTSGGDRDILVAKLSPKGVFQWATGAGGRTADLGQRIAVDNQGVAHVVGYIMSARAVFGAITLPHPNQGTFDAFVATLSPAGVWQWAVNGGGPGNDYGYDLAVDAAGNTYAVGSCSYRATFGSTVLTTAGDKDVMVSKISPTGAYLWAMQAGGTGNDEATSAWLRPNGSLTLAGSTLSSLAVFGNQGVVGNPNADTGFLASLAAGPLSVVSARNVLALMLWPNPARGGEVLHLAGLTTWQPVTVFDAVGRVVLVVSVPATGATEIPLPTGLGSGVYFARAGQQVARFTVQ